MNGPGRLERLPDYKPVSVPLRVVVIHLRRILRSGSSDLPGSSKERAAPPPLFGLAPHGVYPAGPNCFVRGALLPHLFTLTVGKPNGGIFSVALSVERALSAPSRPLAGMLPCGDRTFLSRHPAMAAATARPATSGHHYVISVEMYE